MADSQPTDSKPADVAPADAAPADVALDAAQVDGAQPIVSSLQEPEYDVQVELSELQQDTEHPLASATSFEQIEGL